MTLPELAKLLEAWTIGREKNLLVEGETLYWQLLVDGKPTTVPQTCAELNNPRVDGPMLVAAVNSLPALIALASAAVALLAKHDRLERRAQGRGADPMYMHEPEEITALRAAIDALGAEA